MENKEYYFCPACGEYVYRIPGRRHGDGQQDTDETPVYLLADADSMTTDEIDQADGRPVHCGCMEQAGHV